MNKNVVIIGLVGLLGVLAGCEPEASKPKRIAADWSDIRVGEYNSRAVAMAWVRSDGHNREIEALMAEHQKAKEAGDTKRMKELEAIGREGQDLRHRQVFGDDPIPDVMARLKDALPDRPGCR
jgi:hypothetical protein